MQGTPPMSCGCQGQIDRKMSRTLAMRRSRSRELRGSPSCQSSARCTIGEAGTTRLSPDLRSHFNRRLRVQRSETRVLGRTPTSHSSAGKPEPRTNMATGKRLMPPRISLLRPRRTSPEVPLLAMALLLLQFARMTTPVSAVTFDVSPDGSPYTIAEALDEAGPGDTISLANGTYGEPIATVQGGEEDRPLVISGGRAAIIRAHQNDRVVDVQHSWVTLQGFSIDGKVGDADESDSFSDKCVYVQGDSGGDSFLEGFVMRDVAVTNCGGECVRLRDFVVGAEISGSDISDCGVHDFQYDGGGKNGEAVYIGTSSKQWSDGPDECKDNVIMGNIITPNGNECVDIKEGSTGNIIEGNTCSGQLDANSGCFGARGDGNTFRYNTASDCLGSGVRIGGWEVNGYEYGQDNEVYSNDFSGTEVASLSVQVTPQGVFCDNTCTEGACGVIGTGADEVIDTWEQPCASTDEQDSMFEESSPVEAASTPAPSPTVAVPGWTPFPAETRTPTPIPTYSSTQTRAPASPAYTSTPSAAPSLSDMQSGNGATPSPVDGNDPASSEAGDWDEDLSECDPIELSSSHVSATLGTQAGNNESHLVDGDYSNRWSAEGGGSWFSIELEEAAMVSAVKLWFEDGAERQQSFTMVTMSDEEVNSQEGTSSGDTENGQIFALERPGMISTVIIVGYGNNINDWNSFNEIQLCRGGASRRLREPSRNLRRRAGGRKAAPIAAPPRRRGAIPALWPVMGLVSP